jgi:hypothetical protein
MSCEASSPLGLQVRAHLPVPPVDPGLQISVTISFPPPHAALRMRGRLKHFSPFWRDVLGWTHYALEAVEGFRPHFTSPPSCPAGRALLHPLSGQEQFLHRSRGIALLLKGAIKEVPLFPPPLSYISSIFLVLKKSGGMRPILNKRSLTRRTSTPLTSGLRQSRTFATPSGRGIGRRPETYKTPTFMFPSTTPQRNT